MVWVSNCWSAPLRTFRIKHWNMIETLQCSCHYSLCPAPGVPADRDPAGEPGDRGDHTLPGGPVHQRPQQARERRRPRGGQTSEPRTPACVPSECEAIVKGSRGSRGPLAASDAASCSVAGLVCGIHRAPGAVWVFESFLLRLPSDGLTAAHQQPDGDPIGRLQDLQTLPQALLPPCGEHGSLAGQQTNTTHNRIYNRVTLGQSRVNSPCH